MIEFEDVTKRYPDGTVAVDNLSLTDPEQGEITVLVGPSGCGKTTSLRMINRMIERTAGRIPIDGRDINDSHAVELRRGIGYVIQHGGLFPHRTVARQHRHGAEAARLGQGEGSARASELLEPSGSTPSWPSATRRSCPVASSSASASPGRWRPTRRSC